MWRHGFTKTRRIDNIDNLGAYLSAYLSDIELTDLNKLEDKQVQRDILDYHNGIKELQDKKFIKGGRLYMYPPKFNLYRVSRGIKKPLKKFVQYDTFIENRKKIGLSTTPIFSKTINIKLFDHTEPLIVAREVYKNFIS